MPEHSKEHFTLQSCSLESTMHIQGILDCLDIQIYNICIIYVYVSCIELSVSSVYLPVYLCVKFNKCKYFIRVDLIFENVIWH